MRTSPWIMFAFQKSSRRYELLSPAVQSPRPSCLPTKRTCSTIVIYNRFHCISNPAALARLVCARHCEAIIRGDPAIITSVTERGPETSRRGFQRQARREQYRALVQRGYKIEFKVGHLLQSPVGAVQLLAALSSPDIPSHGRRQSSGT